MQISDDVDSHYRDQFGDPEQDRKLVNRELSLRIYKWAQSAATGGVALYATNGVACHRAADGSAAELVVPFLPACDDVETSLANLAATVIRSGQDVRHGQTWNMGGPLWSGTELDFYVTLHQHSTPAPLDAAGANVEFFHALAIFRYEADLKRDHGLDALKQHWREGRVSFWDPSRSPAKP